MNLCMQALVITICYIFQPSESLARTIKVAVIDTGIDSQHEKLKGKIHLFKKSQPGIDFSSNNEPADINGHGTHIAGLIIQSPDSPEPADVELYNLKYYHQGKQTKDPLDASIEALEKAAELNVDIVNYSGGGSEFNEREFAAIQKLSHKNILVVAAAGNNGRDIDRKGFYPASYDLPNILSVGASDFGRTPSSTSNHGTIKVHVTAPGRLVWSTLPGNNYGPLSGSSQATAIVTHMICLYLQKLDKNPPVEKIKMRVMNTAVKNKNFVGANAVAAQIQIQRFLKMKDFSDEKSFTEKN